MPRVEQEIHQPLLGTLYTPLAIHVGSDVANAVGSKKSTGVTFPMLIDYDNAVVDQYNRLGEGITLFPLGYLIDKRGKVRRIYKETEPSLGSLRAEIDALLAEE